MRALAPQQLRAALRRCDAAAARCAAPAPRRTVPRRTLAAAAGEGSAAAPPPLPDIPKLAAMARLDVTAEEAAAWSPKINAIVDWFGQLRAADLSGVEPALRATSEAGDVPTADADASFAAHSRPDAPADFGAREDMLAAAPRRQPPYIYIPKILKTDDA